MCTFGDGATSKGDFHEALNFAGVHRLPVVFVCENNGYAISVPLRLQAGNPDLASRAAGYGMPGIAVDGTDVPACSEACRAAVARARAGEGPTLIDAKVARFTSHSSDDDQRRYRPQAELEALLRRDPIERFRNYLLDESLLTEEDDERLQQDCTAEVEEAVRAAEAAPQPDPADLGRHVFAESR
jgi:2-oxoisovalerate dehydrogenase E1 component alpha subunit